MKFLIFMSVIFSINTFCQTQDDHLREFMKQRDQMMKEILDAFSDNDNSLLQGGGFFGGLDPFSQEKSIASSVGLVEVSEKYEKDGTISILITPKKENIALDIETKNGMINIRSETQVEQKSQKRGQQSYSSTSKQSFSRSISIPIGYTAKSPVPMGKGVKILLTPSNKTKKDLFGKKKHTKRKKIDRVPIGKHPGEDTL